MNPLKLLIVEDYQPAIESYSDNIESFNKTSNIQVEFDVKENLADAKQALLSPNYDAAIVDLKLSNSENLEGMDIVDDIEKNHRFPIFIVSGSIAQVEREENAFFRKRSRDINFKDILGEIVGIYSTGITQILGKAGKIDEYLNQIFWSHLSNSMMSWVDDTTRTSEEKEKSLLRYTLLHMIEYIDEEVDNYHPNEFYITPPVKKHLFTGDIISFTGNRYMVLTPACDMVIRANGARAAKYILLCRIADIPEVVANISVPLENVSNSKRQRIEAVIKNKSKQNYFFLPKSNGLEHGVVNFQELSSIKEVDVQNLLEEQEMQRIATVANPFLKDIIARYSNYYARQGAPDMDVNEMYKSLSK